MPKSNIFTASIRRDGSSKFGKNNKYGYFPSAAFAWSIGKEEFMKQQKIFSDMKLRLSYGVTGNDRIPAYQSLSRTDKTYYSGDNNSVQLGLSPSEISNPDLKWETTYQLNGGLDISMFRNRLSIEADVYYKKTKDMLLHADVPSQIGSYRQWQNIGQVDNKGFELTINTVNIQKRNFTWSTSLNFNLNRNKVVSLGDVSSIPVKVAGGHITEVGRVMVGHPIGSGWGYVFDGIYQQSDFDERGNLKEGVPSFAGITVKPGDMKFKDIAGNDNVIDPNNDKTVIANSDPKHFGGMTNSFTFKNFDLKLHVPVVLRQRHHQHRPLPLRGFRGLQQRLDGLLAQPLDGGASGQQVSVAQRRGQDRNVELLRRGRLLPPPEKPDGGLYAAHAHHAQNRTLPPAGLRHGRKPLHLHGLFGL